MELRLTQHILKLLTEFAKTSAKISTYSRIKPKFREGATNLFLKKDKLEFDGWNSNCPVTYDFSFDNSDAVILHINVHNTKTDSIYTFNYDSSIGEDELENTFQSLKELEILAQMFVDSLTTYTWKELSDKQNKELIKSIIKDVGKENVLELLEEIENG